MFFIFSCAPKTVTTLPVKDYSWHQEIYDSLKIEWNSISKTVESQNYEVSHMALLEKLFYGSIDERNDETDYLLSYHYAELLINYSGIISHDFNNWLQVLTILNTESNKNNSLAQTIINQQNEILIYEQKQEISINENNDLKLKQKQLQDKVASQAEVIEKLKKLELFMENSRKQF